MGGKVKTGFVLRTTCSNTINKNCWLSQKFELLEKGKFNHLTIILTLWMS